MEVRGLYEVSSLCPPMSKVKLGCQGPPTSHTCCHVINPQRSLFKNIFLIFNSFILPPS